MFRQFNRLSISIQAIVFLLFTLGATLSAFFFWASDNVLIAERQHARTVADMVDSFRAVAAKHGGFYVRRQSTDDVEKMGRFLATYNSTISGADGTTKEYVFHHKNPFLALGDYSNMVETSAAKAKFRMVSDNYMNPANIPDEFDKAAMAQLRADNAKEYWDIAANKLRYARPLVADKSCLNCHGDPLAAPETVKAQYKPIDGVAKGGGYGYREGEIVGITSVSVSHVSVYQMLGQQSVGFWVSVGAIITIMFMSYVAVLRGIVKPLSSLSEYATQVATSAKLSEIQGPVYDRQESSSLNQIHKQSFALKSLHESMRIALKHILGRA
jgi:hypothetical protein